MNSLLIYILCISVLFSNQGDNATATDRFRRSLVTKEELHLIALFAWCVLQDAPSTFCTLAHDKHCGRGCLACFPAHYRLIARHNTGLMLNIISSDAVKGT